MAKVKLLLVAEMEIEDASNPGLAQIKLDEFREAVLPGSEYGITLSRATQQDVSAFFVNAVAWIPMIVDTSE